MLNEGTMDLSLITLLLGGVLALIYLFMILMPAAFRKILSGFPRNLIAGWVLSAICIAWAAKLVYDMPLGTFDEYKSMLFVIGPVLFVLVVLFMDDLLAARALGGLMLLVPAPLLDAARWHKSSLRLIVVVFAYIMVIKGIVLVFSPFVMRKQIERFITSDKLCRVFGSIGMVVALVLLCLGLFVF